MKLFTRILDRTLSILLILGGIGHTVRAWKLYSDRSLILFSMCTALFIFLFAAISLLRAARPTDGALGWICTVTGMAFLLGCAYFGRVVLENVLDPRALAFAAITLGLMGFSVRTILQSPD
jgi:hypothetical protein